MVLALHGVSKTFRGPVGAVPALQGVDLALAGGEFGVITGPSGSGKSTLLLVAGGMLRPDAGSVRLGGGEVYAGSPARRAALRAGSVGFVFQQFHLLPQLSVLHNILVPGLAGGGLDLDGRARELAERLGLGQRLDHLPAALSTGERQRVALARALLRGPALLLADEPTGNLDEANAAVVWSHLQEFARTGGAVLAATHDGAVAGRSARRWAMDQGVLAAQGAAP
jgi:putative ABC transport system ATP-binding protein